MNTVLCFYMVWHVSSFPNIHCAHLKQERDPNQNVIQMDNESTWQWWKTKAGRQTTEFFTIKITVIYLEIMTYLDFTSLWPLIMSGIQRNNLITIKSPRADNNSSANKEVILEIHRLLKGAHSPSQLACDYFYYRNECSSMCNCQREKTALILSDINK